MNHPHPENKQGNSRLPGRLARILVAPLDWGLGHATRCIPIIHELLHQHCEVLLAAEGKQEQLLRNEFPLLTILPLHGYRVKYAKTKSGLFWKMLLQIPGLVKKIQREHKWLQAAVDEYSIDAVISDNRYGLYHTVVPSVFITHQLLIKTGMGKWADRVLQKRNYKYIRHFTACWVPDDETDGLAGELSHPFLKPNMPLYYTGPLSRFKTTGIKEIPGHLLILLSGPEPQRTILEEKIINDIGNYGATAVIVRGLPGAVTLIPSTGMIKFYNHLPSDELNTEMQKADFVISRCGYSTIMDIAALQKKSILIPTPGQTEQEYLGACLAEIKLAYVISQEDFKLPGALQAAKEFNYHSFPSAEKRLLKETVTQFLQSLHSS